MLYMGYMLYLFTEEGECDGIRVLYVDPFVKEGECDGKCVLCVISIRREGVIWYTCMYVMCI